MQLNNAANAPEPTDEELVARQKEMNWEATRQAVIDQTQASIYAQLRTTQVTIAIGVANGDFSAVFRNDIRTLLLQMAAGIEVQG